MQLKLKIQRRGWAVKQKIMKNPNPKNGEGCGYSLTVFGNADEVINAFDIGKLKYTGYEKAK